MNKRLTLFSFLLVFALIFAGCSTKNNSVAKKGDKLSVYTTIFPLADFTKKIGGDYVNVETIYPPGADSHTYEPSQKQTVQIAKADLFVYNGAGLEPFAEKMEKTLKQENVQTVNASQGIDLHASSEDEHHEQESDHKEHGHHHDQDPHVWLDPILAMKQAEKIKDALVKLQPEHKKEFEKNFAALQTKFTDLDDHFKSVVTNAKTKEILVSHAAYGYWEHRYGLKQIPIAGISSSEEPSQKELAAITKTAKEHGLKYILFETFSTPKVAEVIQKETGTKILRLNHLATISEDDVKKNKDYFTLMEENVNVLKEATN
ncbi:metal ABC transporter substrate-binding protein [Bacillus cytotoxicus]|uniref:Periplasmic solute binding protein n=1 Tax=Bacillus cytotoxicus (strain DSM 22905 / CIP 110041 / 391-98 / NVH 391-98) TaxID=315749 RepID=A7GNY1_BACCN|nr:MULTISPECIES: metal ABC transporter substrate-binding protein [Bacillus cereus group]ABS21839.1 periplasmic solute binding protein [Bacillus cytotoxicus NVH 391-98]AWC44530.1 adhesin [Bacillus cytotoxicus]MDH2863201.1 metal ABC transporter substrate-binding protein [Bacillus cytotoxicus]MDH2882870.1 metal ABC transporter substrate-binding protein [Bacillus cytotoxicus]MDH2887137.1 metal ABC transporter substrate-binding protein [Bacillus cytotoxicus]